MTEPRSEPKRLRVSAWARADEFLSRLKTANEERQRSTRKARAEGRLPPHEPRWFISSTDNDSGERLWQPKRAETGEVKFWHDRETAPGSKWAEVDHIFVED
jgi:hypothetical protein